MNPIVLIPARLASTRLPAKALADIHGLPMIVHVLRRAEEADIGAVVVATDTPAIAEAVQAAGGRAVMTGDHHQSGSDRIAEALARLDPEGRHDVIVNVQGDLPSIAPRAIRASLAPMVDPAVALATLVAEIKEDADRTASQVVKMIGSEIAPGRFRCLYFTRATAPWGGGAALAPYRPLCLAAGRTLPLRRTAALGAGAAGEAGTAAGAGSGHADRRHGGR